MKRAQKLPEMGSRSKVNFGIELLFASEWFNQNSSCGGTPMSQPDIKPFEKYRDELRKIRQQFIGNAFNAGHSKDDATRMWKAEMGRITDYATQIFQRLCGQRFSHSPVPYNENTLQAAEATGVLGIEKSRKLIDASHWSVSLFTKTPTGPHIYCLTKIADGRPCIKVGKSDQPNGDRIAQQLTTPGTRFEWFFHCANPRKIEADAHRMMESEGANRAANGDWFFCGASNVSPESIWEFVVSLFASEVSMETRPITNGEGQGRFLHDAPVLFDAPLWSASTH